MKATRIDKGKGTEGGSMVYVGTSEMNKENLLWYVIATEKRRVLRKKQRREENSKLIKILRGRNQMKWMNIIE